MIQSPYTVHIIPGMLSVALLLLIDFTRKYRATKAWLDETAEKEYKQEKEL